MFKNSLVAVDDSPRAKAALLRLSRIPVLLYR